MESQFLKENFVVLGSRQNNENLNLSFDNEPPNPILASTGNMHPNRANTSNSSHDSKRSFNLQDDSASSVGVLDLHEMSDTSLFNLNGGNSDSLGSWMNLACDEDESINIKRCSSDFKEMQLRDNVFKNPLERNKAVDVPDSSPVSNFSQSNIPSLTHEIRLSKNYNQGNVETTNLDLRPSTSSQYSSYSQYNLSKNQLPEENKNISLTDSYNSENSFEFNEEELDIGIQQPDEDVVDGDLNETMTSVQTHQPSTDGFKPLAQSSSSGGMTSTFDFLKGMGFNLKNQNLANTSIENKSYNQPSKDSVNMTPNNRLDSKYFAPNSEDVSGLSQDNFDSSNDITQTPVNKPTISYSNNPFNSFSGQQMQSGKLSFGNGKMSMENQSGAFNDFDNAPPVDFNGLEFQNTSILQQDLVGDDDFVTAGDAADILAADEEDFKKEHEFSLAENFDQNAQQTHVADFSTFRTSVMTLHDEMDETGKVSIGTYMAERSDKLGSLEQKPSSERPCFGMKVKTPSPQKPFRLVDSMSLTTINDVSCEESDTTKIQETSSQKPQQSEDIDLSAFIMDDSVDKSMMSSLSKALSNMSATMNNEELAKFLLALSNQKAETKQSEHAKSSTSLSLNDEPKTHKRQSDVSKRLSRIPLPSSYNKTRPSLNQHLLSSSNNDSTLKDQTKTLISSNNSSSSSTYSSKSNTSVVQNTLVNQSCEPLKQNQSKVSNYSKLNDKSLPVNQSVPTSTQSLNQQCVGNQSTTVSQNKPVNQNLSSHAVSYTKSSNSSSLPVNASECEPTKPNVIRQNRDFNNVKQAKENLKTNRKESFQKPVKEKIIDQKYFDGKENKPEINNWMSSNEDIVKSPAMKSSFDLEELPCMPNNESLMSKEMLSNLLSSTRLSLLRGSLSRESIEKLHKKLRVKGDDSKEEHVDYTSPTKNFDESISKGKHLHNDCWANTLKLEEDNFKKSTDDDDPFPIKGVCSRPSVAPLSESSPPSSRLSAAFQQLDPSTSFNEMATIAEGHFDPKFLPDLGVIQEEEGESSLRRKSGRFSMESEKGRKGETENKSQRSSLDSNISKHDLSSLSAVDSIPKASSTRSNESEFNPDHPPPTNFTHHYPMPMMGYGGMYQGFPNQTMMHMHAPPMSSLSMGQPGYASDAQAFNNTVFSTRSHPAYNYPSMMSYRPSMAHSTVMSHCQQPNRGISLDGGYYDEIPSIVVPSELMFNKTLCSGVPSSVVLPLKNKSTRWLQVDIRIITLSINNQCLTLDLHEYVSIKPKHMVGPHCIETVDVGLTCNKPGQCQLVIEVLSCLISMEGITQPSPHCHASTVNVFATVVNPKIRVYRGPNLPQEWSKLNQVLDFNEIMEGTKKSMPLRILNESKSEIPARVILFTSSQDRNNFSLSLSSTPTNQDVGRGSLSLLRTNLAVSDQPLIVWVHFTASTLNTSTDQQPQTVEGKIEVILDAPFKSPETRSQVQTSLGTIAVKALVGIAKLHARKSQQLLLFSACRGEKQSKKCPVKNAGNITVDVKFILSSHQEYFTLTPSTATMSPGSDVEVNVEFCPPSNAEITEKDKPITTYFLMIISPTGPQFEVEIKAQVTEAASSHSSLGSKGSQGTSPSLLTNKTRLRWLGVKIGQSQKQKLALRCGKQSGKAEFSFRSTIKGDNTNCFQIVTEDNGCDELCSRCDMSIMPGQDKSINILFQPSKRKLVEAKLEIKTPIYDLPTTKYTIPLSGYGGASNVRIEGLDQSSLKLPPLKNNHIPQCCIMNIKGNNQGSTFLLTNTGSRSAFVRIIVYSDSTFKTPYHEASCSPSQFVLQEQQTKKITITLKMNAQQCWISIWNGDELSRQLMKLALSNQTSASSLISRCVSQATMVLKDVAFDGIYDGDGNADEDLTSVQPHSYDVQTFYNNIKLICVQVQLQVDKKIDDISLSSITSLKHIKPVPTGSIDDEIPERDVGFLLAKLRNQSAMLPKDKSLPPFKYTPKDFSLNWDINPSHVTLATPQVTSVPSYGVPEPTRVKIINKSLASLVFDVMWPGHYLTITPNRGRVDPESVATLLVSANPSLSSTKDLLPWCGEAIVMATSGAGEDNKRIIHVQIKSSNKSSLPSNPDPKPSEDCDLSLVPSCARNEPKHTDLKVMNSTIDFGNVNLGYNAKSNLEFRNMSKNNTKWILTSFAPPYVKDAENSGKLFRSTYAAFVFTHTSGILEPGARIQVPVTFNPMNPGIYSQHWEIEYHSMSDDAGLNLDRVKILLQGQSQGSHNTRKELASSTSSRNPNREDIYISNDTYCFPKTKVGKSAVVKIPIKNKGKTAHTIKFVNLRLPFHMSHQKHTIRSMHCVNLPVMFKPTSAGTYNGSLVIQTENGESLKVQLVGSAVV